MKIHIIIYIGPQILYVPVADDLITSQSLIILNKINSISQTNLRLSNDLTEMEDSKMILIFTNLLTMLLLRHF